MAAPAPAPMTRTARAPTASRRRRFTRRKDGRGSGRARPEDEPDRVGRVAHGGIAELARPPGGARSDHDALPQRVDDERGPLAGGPGPDGGLSARRPPARQVDEREVADEAGPAEDVH